MKSMLAIVAVIMLLVAAGCRTAAEIEVEDRTALQATSVASAD